MNIQESRRAAFEEKNPMPEGLRWNHESQSYEGGALFWLWMDRWNTWNAALGSVVVGLPAVREIRNGRCGNEYDSGVNFGVELCLEAIEVAGIRCEVKP